MAGARALFPKYARASGTLNPGTNQKVLLILYFFRQLCSRLTASLTSVSKLIYMYRPIQDRITSTNCIVCRTA